jgi:hypothetical protein
VFDAQRSSSAQGNAEADAKEDGTAFCRAAAPGEGAAKAEFQLGQVVTIPAAEGAQGAKVAAIFELDYEYLLETDITDTTKPNDKLALKAYISDSEQNMVGKLMLVDLESDVAPNRFAGQQSPAFQLTLEPGRAYHFIVAGLVEVTGTQDSAAKAEIKVNLLKLEILPADGQE